MKLVNKTINNQANIHEATRAMGKAAYKYCIILSVIIVAVVGFLFFTATTESFMIFAFIALAGGILIWEYATKKIKNSEVSAMNQIRKIYKEDFYESTITFSDEVVTIETKTTTKEFERKMIERYQETDNLIIIYYSGKSFLIVEKNGFITGSLQELKAYLEGSN